MIILTPNNDYCFYGRDETNDPSDDHNLDWKVIKETWVENVYHLQPKDFGDIGIFVDVGANIGSVTLYVDSFNDSREELPPITSYAIEPEPHNLEFLYQNLAVNPHSEHIKIVKKALAATNGKAIISNRGGNSRLEEDADGTEVDTVTISQFFKDNHIEEVDVMKIDIEGHEYDLLINTPDDVLDRIKYITLEFDANKDGRFGIMVDKLSRLFGIQILGSPDRGGYIFARRY